MLNPLKIVRKIPLTWLVPFALLAVIALINVEWLTRFSEILKTLVLFARNPVILETLILLALALPAIYYSGLFRSFFNKNKLSAADIRFLYATHILKRIVIHVDNIQRKYLIGRNINEIPLERLEEAHREFRSAINIFRYDSMKLQEENGYAISNDELEAVMDDDKALFAQSPLKNLEIRNVYGTIELLNRF